MLMAPIHCSASIGEQVMVIFRDVEFKNVLGY